MSAIDSLVTSTPAAHPSFTLHIDDIRQSTCGEAIAHLLAHEKKVAAEVTIFDLSTLPPVPNGVYLFFDDDNALWYAGKATSRSFVERIPSHFDPRPEGWFGTLPKKVMSYAKHSTYQQALDLALSLRLLIIGVPDKNEAMRLERFLRSAMKPLLNPVAARHDPDCRLSDMLSAAA